MAGPEDRDKSRQAIRGLDTAIAFGVEVALPTLLGYWADQQLGWMPALTLVGLTLGFGGGLYHLIRALGPRK